MSGWGLQLQLLWSPVMYWAAVCGIKATVMTMCLYFQNVFCLYNFERLVTMQNN